MTRFSCHRSWHFRLRLRLGLASTWIELWHDRIIIQIVWMLFVANRRPYRGYAAEWGGGEGTIFGDLQRSPLSRDRKRSWWTLTAFAASPGHASWLAKSPQLSSLIVLCFYVLCVFFFFFFLFIIVVILLLFVFNTFGFLNTLGSFCCWATHLNCDTPSAACLRAIAAAGIVKLLLIRRKSKSSTAQRTHTHTHTQSEKQLRCLSQRWHNKTSTRRSHSNSSSTALTLCLSHSHLPTLSLSLSLLLALSFSPS